MTLMRCHPIYVLFVGILLCLGSCAQENTEEARQILAGSEEALASDPDLLIGQLDSLDISAFPEAERGELYLLRARAKAQTDLSLAADTTQLTEAIAWFTKRDDDRKLALSYLMRSKAWYDAKQFSGEADRAMLDALEAKRYAEMAGDNALLTQIYQEIGDIFFARSHFGDALVNFQTAYELAGKEGLMQELIFTSGRISSAYNILEKPDSALLYQQQALAIMQPIAEYSDYNGYITALLYKNMSVSYGEMDDYRSQKAVLLEAYRLMPAGMESDRRVILSQLSEVYLKLNRRDSALYYAGLYPDKENESAHEKALKARHWYTIHKAQGDYPRALENLETYTRNAEIIHNQERAASVVEIQQKYDKQLVENEYNRVLLQRLFLIALATVILLTGSLLALSLSYRMRKKEKSLLEAYESLEAMRQMLTSREDELASSRRDREALAAEMVGSLAEKEERLRQFLIEKLDIARRVAKMNLVPTDNGKVFMIKYRNIFGHDLLDEIGWPNISAVIAELYDDFPAKIAARFPRLTQKELQLCCLIRAGFRTEEICVFLNYTQNTVRVNKSHLRQKMGFTDYETFLLFLLSV